MADILDRLRYAPSKVTGPGQVEIDNDKLRELLADASAEIERLSDALKGATVITNTASGEIKRLTKALEAAAGYLMNAAIDLNTGAPKRTALATIEGGIKVVRAALTGNREGEKG